MPLICFSSPKGGVGKTSLTANIAHALSRAGRRIALLDLDPQNALRLHFGVPLGDTAGFMTRLAGHGDPLAMLRQTPAGPALLPHGAVDMHQALALGAMLGADPGLLMGPVQRLLADPELILLADTPPGASQAMAAILPAASLVVVVLLADAASTALLPQVESGAFLGQGTLGSLFASRARFVLNQVDPASRLSVSSAESVAGHLGQRLLGAVLRDPALSEALAYQRLVLDHAPEATATRDIRAISAAIAATIPRPPPAFAQPAPAPPMPALLDPANWSRP
jgi:cellulose synthase operon protein YhjQ